MYQFKVEKLIIPRTFIKRYAWFTFFILSVLVAILFLPWVQTVRGVGELIALDPMERNYNISATVDGVLEEVYVQENQWVNKGDKLFSMRDLDSGYQKSLESINHNNSEKYDNETIKLSNLENNLKKQEEILQKGTRVYAQKTVQLNNTLSALENEQIAYNNKYNIAKINYQRTLSLFNSGIESQRNLELKENDKLIAEAQVKKIESQIYNNKSQLTILTNEKSRFSSEMRLKSNQVQNNILVSKNLLKTINQSMTQKDVEIARYQSRTIRAKRNGYIIRVFQNDKNRFIKRGEDILFFSPEVTKRALRIVISSFHMPLMKEDVKARVLFYGWPAMQVSGWPEVSHGTYPGVVESIEKVAHEKNRYYIIVTEDLNDEAWPDKKMLKIGSKATIWVNLNTVSLGYELWRLMFALPPEIKHTIKDDL